jgi:membrane protein implicated in regulation of membrane protease activity
VNLRDRPLPKRPFRDSAIAYGILAAAVVGIGVLTGGALLKTVVIAVVFFVVATAYSWWRFRQRLAREGRRP